MPDHKQGQKNADDVGRSWDRYRDTVEKHMPRRHASITDYTNTIGTKRGF
jgi:hypothetical protein